MQTCIDGKYVCTGDVEWKLRTNYKLKIIIAKMDWRQ